MSVGRIILPQFMPATDSDGDPLPGARLSVFRNLTTILEPVFADFGLTTALPNPVIASASGTFPAIFVPAGEIEDPVLYTLAVTDRDGKSVGRPSVFTNYPPSFDYDTATVALVEAAADEAVAAAAEAVAAAASIIGSGNPATTPYTRALLLAANEAQFKQAGSLQGRIQIDPRDLPWGAVFDGTADVVSALNAALAYAAPRGQTVVMPSGIGRTDSGTIFVPTGASLDSGGETLTILLSSAPNGVMVQYGTNAQPYQGGGSHRGFWAAHDYGLGPGLPNLSSQITHPSANKTIFKFYGPYNAVFHGLRAYGGKIQMHRLGGSTSAFINCRTAGVFDPQVPALQASTDGLLIERGENTDLPTSIAYYSCQFGGTILSPTGFTPTIPPVAIYRDITWPDPGGTGPHVTTNVTTNIGSQRILHIKCMEGGTFDSCYFGSGAKHNIAIDANGSDPMSGIGFVNCFMDAAGEDQFAFEGNATAFGVWAHFHDWNGQNNTFSAITDKNNTAAFGSVDGFTLEAPIRALVGPGGKLTNNPRGVTINSTIKWYNVNSFYNGLDGYNCAFHFDLDAGNFAQDINVGGTWGGDNSCEVATYTQVGLYLTGANTRVDHSKLVNGGISNTGTLVKGGFSAASIRVTDGNFSLRQRSVPCVVDFLGPINAARTVTIDLAGAQEGDFWLFHIGATLDFPINVVGADTFIGQAKGDYVRFDYFSGGTPQARITASHPAM